MMVSSYAWLYFHFLVFLYKGKIIIDGFSFMIVFPLPYFLLPSWCSLFQEKRKIIAWLVHETLHGCSYFHGRKGIVWTLDIWCHARIPCHYRVLFIVIPWKSYYSSMFFLRLCNKALLRKAKTMASKKNGGFLVLSINDIFPQICGKSFCRGRGRGRLH